MTECEASSRLASSRHSVECFELETIWENTYYKAYLFPEDVFIKEESETIDTDHDDN